MTDFSAELEALKNALRRHPETTAGFHFQRITVAGNEKHARFRIIIVPLAKSVNESGRRIAVMRLNAYGTGLDNAIKEIGGILLDALGLPKVKHTPQEEAFYGVGLRLLTRGYKAENGGWIEAETKDYPLEGDPDHRLLQAVSKAQAEMAISRNPRLFGKKVEHRISVEQAEHEHLLIRHRILLARRPD
ncbi:MAG: hypothetical protein V1787_04190 [Candidatus Micrarchaeota archaeon]